MPGAIQRLNNAGSCVLRPTVKRQSLRQIEQRADALNHITDVFHLSVNEALQRVQVFVPVRFGQGQREGSGCGGFCVFGSLAAETTAIIRLRIELSPILAAAREALHMRNIDNNDIRSRHTKKRLL